MTRPEDPERRPATSDPAAMPTPHDDGVDRTLIRANLRLSPVERLRRGDAARRSVQWLRSRARRVTDD